MDGEKLDRDRNHQYYAQRTIPLGDADLGAMNSTNAYRCLRLAPLGSYLTVAKI